MGDTENVSYIIQITIREVKNKLFCILFKVYVICVMEVMGKKLQD